MNIYQLSFLHYLASYLSSLVWCGEKWTQCFIKLLIYVWSVSELVKFVSKLKRNIRLITQCAFTAITNGYLIGFTKGTIFKGETKALCVPGLNCYSCPGALGSCPIGSLQAVLGSRDYKMAFYVTGFLLFFGAIMGRFVCGFLCPFGLVQDLLYKIPFPKKIKRLPGDGFLKYLKYMILVLTVIILPLVAVDFLGQGDPWFCKYICPSGTLSGGIPLVITNVTLRSAIGGLFWWKMGVLFFLLFLSIIVYRPFCRYLCPLGAIYGLFNPIAFYRFGVNKEKCTGCKVCQKTCHFNIPVYEKPNSMECIRCGDCKAACPHHAIDSTFKNQNKNAL